jgi:nucleotide-binding universal stress UspA family protein
MYKIQIVLHPTDFSEPARTAFHLACSLARDHGARLLLLHVAEPVLDYRGTASLVYGNEGGTVQTPVESHKVELKEKLRQFAVPEPPVAADYEVVEGDPAEQVLNYAHKTNTDLIVMGTHGRTGLGRLLMGSVAEKVVRGAHCPVLTVKVTIPEEPSSPIP